jgi:hypothetical protein
MRPIFTIFALIFTLTLYSCGETIVDYNEDKEHIEELSDVFYYKGTPFSGTMIWNGKGEKDGFWDAISGQLEKKELSRMEYSWGENSTGTTKMVS